MVLIDALKFLAMLVLGLLALRLIETRAPESSLGRALAFLH